MIEQGSLHRKSIVLLFFFAGMILLLSSCAPAHIKPRYEALDYSQCEIIEQGLESENEINFILEDGIYYDFFNNQETSDACVIRYSGLLENWTAPLNTMKNMEWEDTMDTVVGMKGETFVYTLETQIIKDNFMCTYKCERYPSEATLCNDESSYTGCWDNLKPSQKMVTVELRCIQQIPPSASDKVVGTINANSKLILWVFGLSGILGFILIGRSTNRGVIFFGVFISAPAVTIILMLMFGTSMILAEDFLHWDLVEPGSYGSLMSWISYGIKGGLALFVSTFIFAIGMMFASIIIGAIGQFVHIFEFGGAIYIWLPPSPGPDGGGWGCIVPVALIVLSAIPYGLVQGISKYALYRLGMPELVDKEIVTMGIMMVLIWIVGVFFALNSDRS